MDQVTQTDGAEQQIPDQAAIRSAFTAPIKDRFRFVKGVFSDGDQPSSSRVLTFLLAMADILFLVWVFLHIIKLTDATLLGLWLNNLPLIIAALVGLMAAPYTINKASGSITDIINSLRKTS